MLLSAGAYFNLKNVDGLTPLMIAALFEKKKPPNHRMFLTIDNGSCHRLKQDDQIFALELIGAFILCDDKFIDWCHVFWENAIRLRLNNQVWNMSIVRVAFLEEVIAIDVSQIQNFHQLEFLYSFCDSML